MFTTLPTSLARRASRVLVCCAIPLALLALGAAGASAKPKARSIACKGGSSSCVATVSLAGGASNVKLKITLTDTNLKLVSVTAKPKEVKRAYSLSKGSYSLGGSVYTTTLNAVQSIRKGATLTLKFAAPSAKLSCASTNKAISSITIAKAGSPATGTFTCQQAAAVTDTWALRFEAFQSVSTFEVNEVQYKCGLAPSVPQNTQCEGGGTLIKFAAPTGH